MICLSSLPEGDMVICEEKIGEETIGDNQKRIAAKRAEARGEMLNVIQRTTEKLINQNVI